jgi:hypothetical protein
MTCEGLTEGTCGARQGCQQLYCATCAGGRSFVGCGALGGDGAACPLTICLPSCADLRDETSCKARPDCKPLSCSDCRGGQTFAGCDAPGGAGVACGACPPPSPSCASLGETACKARSDCSARNCSTCGGPAAFSACYRTGDTPPICLAIPCPQPAPCSFLNESSCDARTDCHSVFVDKPICDCAVAGCCASFSRCADGGKAACKGTPACQIATPYCEAPAYVVSYTANCYEGCVRPTECAP